VKARNYRATKNQVIARKIVAWLKEKGVTRLIVGDLTGIRNMPRTPQNDYIWKRVQEWPCFDLQSRVNSCCHEEGIVTEPGDQQFVSQTCPCCGSTDRAQVDLARHMFACLMCTYKRDLDKTAAFNLLKRSGCELAVRGILDRAKAARERLGGAAVPGIARNDEIGSVSEPFPSAEAAVQVGASSANQRRNGTARKAGRK
jgi:IS605 OrfB family transposase